MILRNSCCNTDYDNPEGERGEREVPQELPCASSRGKGGGTGNAVKDDDGWGKPVSRRLFHSNEREAPVGGVPRDTDRNLIHRKKRGSISMVEDESGVGDVRNRLADDPEMPLI
ncbi:hypothetical protein NPIL_162371 [Nephila pilipes]|uniref:Uncharacterized protein n=1 Tax=Nephila pilipes TaxID=299642 RepID=A0A8X6Q7B8_NEPPI|nr:hypothetical protein NPIL_162371 [Nephila pilipes]